MSAPAKTTTVCRVCTHHVAVTAGRIAEHYMEGRPCDGSGLAPATVAPVEMARLNANLTEMAEQVTEFVSVYQVALRSGDRFAALVRTADTIVDEGYEPAVLVRLLAFAVARLAGGA